jgi:hypothetical protein
MPAYTAVALAAGFVTGWLRRHPRAASRLAVSVVVAVVLWAQVDRIGYSLNAQIPTAADRRAGEGFVNLIRRLPGEVLVFDHPYYGVLAGKGTVADEEAAQDVERSGPSAARRTLVADMRGALLRPQVGAVILDTPGDERNLEPALARQYHLHSQPAIEGHVFYPVTDLPLRPWFVFVRNNTSRAASGHGT